MTVQSPTRTTRQDSPEAPAFVQRSPMKPRSRWRRRLTKLDEKGAPYAYVSPFFILFGVVGLFPLLYTAWVSLHKWSLIGGQGARRPQELHRRARAALLLERAEEHRQHLPALERPPGHRAPCSSPPRSTAACGPGRSGGWACCCPTSSPPVAVALIFSDLFGDKFGLVNHLLGLVGVDPVQWHKEVLPSHVAIATMVNFRWTGYNALIFLAAMQAIPRDYYEAAMIDGAGRVRTFFSITVPQLRATIIFVVITSTIGGLQIFDEPRMYDQYGLGGADRQWQTLTLYLYQLGWTQKNFGRAAAVAWMLFLIVVVFAVVNFLVTRRIASKGQR